MGLIYDVMLIRPFKSASNLAPLGILQDAAVATVAALEVFQCLSYQIGGIFSPEGHGNKYFIYINKTYYTAYIYYILQPITI